MNRILEKARRIGVCLEYSRVFSSYVLLPYGLQEVSRKELSILKGNGNSEGDESTKKCILFLKNAKFHAKSKTFLKSDNF